jgi:hypothetical protein
MGALRGMALSEVQTLASPHWLPDLAQLYEFSLQPQSAVVSRRSHSEGGLGTVSGLLRETGGRTSTDLASQCVSRFPWGNLQERAGHHSTSLARMSCCRELRCDWPTPQGR